MVFLKKEDYLNQNKKNRRTGTRTRGSHGGIATNARIRLPTQMKSNDYFCRNCNKQLESGKELLPCPQCGHSNKKPLTRRMK